MCGVVIVAGCSAPAPSQGPSSATSSPSAYTSTAWVTLDCNAIGDNVPSSDSVVVLGTLALPDPTNAPALQTARQPDPTSPVLSLFAKAGLGVRLGSRWRLVVPPAAQDHLRIGWGSPGTSTVVIPPAACSQTSRTGWFWYPGGYWTDKPGCYAVIVEVGEDQRQQVNVGVGAPCPGQEPPAGHSDK